MSRHDRVFADAAGAGDRTGAAVVSSLAALAPAEARFVIALRLWLDGAQGQAAVWSGFSTALGTRRGRTALAAFEAMLSIAAEGAQGALWRRPSGCPRLSRDEAAFAAVIRCAGAGDLPGAVAMAHVVTRPQAAARLAIAAGEVAPLLGEATAWRRDPFRPPETVFHGRAATHAPASPDTLH
jgi:hypothetical protein